MVVKRIRESPPKSPKHSGLGIVLNCTNLPRIMLVAWWDCDGAWYCPWSRYFDPSLSLKKAMIFLEVVWRSGQCKDPPSASWIHAAIEGFRLFILQDFANYSHDFFRSGWKLQGTALWFHFSETSDSKSSQNHKMKGANGRPGVIKNDTNPKLHALLL